MATKLNNKRKLLYILLPLVVLGIVVLRLAGNKQEALSKVYHYDKEKAISVQVDTVRAGSASEERAFTGTFDPDREVKVSAEVQGKITDMLVDVGSRVTKGQPLVQLDRSLLQLQLQGVEVQLDGLRADVARYTVLAQADAVQGVQLEKAQLGFRAAEVQKATLVEQIAKATIHAPFDGVVTAKLTEVGAFAAPGVPLVQLTDIATLRFTVNIPEGDIGFFNRAGEFSLSTDNDPDLRLTGKVAVVGSKANMANSYPVQLLVRNTADQRILAGMFGKVHVQESSSAHGVVIPSAAITGGSGSAKVYLVKEGQATLQPITVSGTLGNRSVVTSGLHAGDIIITKGLINLFDGAVVAAQ